MIISRTADMPDRETQDLRQICQVVRRGSTPSRHLLSMDLIAECEPLERLNRNLGDLLRVQRVSLMGHVMGLPMFRIASQRIMNLNIDHEPLDVTNLANRGYHAKLRPEGQIGFHSMMTMTTSTRATCHSGQRCSPPWADRLVVVNSN